MKPAVKRTNDVIIIRSIIVLLIVITAVIALILGNWLHGLLNRDCIYKGVYINHISVSGKTPGEVESMLMETVQSPASVHTITLKSDIGSASFTLSDIAFGYDISNAVEAAYSIGRRGSVPKRLCEMLITGTREVNISLEPVYDNQKLEGIIEEFYKNTLVLMEESQVFINEETVAVHGGHKGMNIDRDKVVLMIKDILEKPCDQTLQIPVQVIYPSRIDTDRVYESIMREPRNAVARVEDNSVVIDPHVNGRSVDREALLKTIDAASSREDSVYTLDLSVTVPPITSEVAQTMIFRDVLGEFGSTFYTGNENDRNRGENIRLASEKINNTLLGPGEVFSFNEVVGPRTAETGYRTAHIYIAGEVVDGIGGGICQVSSTLYITTLYAGLETVERLNHIFTVGYVPLGQDATVSYGSIDFRFRNSTAWPIRIEADVTNENEVVFRLAGTKEEPGKSIELVPEIRSKTPFVTTYIDDPELYEGVEIVKQEGKDGYTVDTHKIVKLEDEIVSNTLIHRSTYRPLAKQVRRGTKKRPESTSPVDSTEPPGAGEDADPSVPPNSSEPFNADERADLF